MGMIGLLCAYGLAFLFLLFFLGGRGPARVGNGKPAPSVHLQRRPRRPHGENNMFL